MFGHSYLTILTSYITWVEDNPGLEELGRVEKETEEDDWTHVAEDPPVNSHVV